MSDGRDVARAARGRAGSSGLLADGRAIAAALPGAVAKLDPRRMVRSPVMFSVEVGAVLITGLAILRACGYPGGESPAFVAFVAAGLWATVLFSTFAESLAEGRGRAQADAMRSMRKDTPAKRLAAPRRDAGVETVGSPVLRAGDFVLIEAGDLVPGDGEVVEGVASVDESAITGESAPVIRESGGDRNTVTGGTRLLSDWLVVRITADPGDSFLDRMIGLIEGAKRQKTPNEIALDILLAGLTLVFLVVTATLLPFSLHATATAGRGEPIGLAVLAALFVCLAPTTIGGLLPAIGIAGIDRMVRANVLATSGRAVEAAGDVDVLLLDKTGTITLGNRQAAAFLPAAGVTERDLADAAQLASLADETPEGRSIVVLAKERHGIRGREISDLNATFVPFTAQTRMSGVDLDGRRIRKGARDAVVRSVEQAGGAVDGDLHAICDAVAKAGSTPLLVADGARVLGVVELKDIVKGGIAERFKDLRAMGIRTVMITGDNPLTAAAIAAEAGVDDFLAEATPEAKLAMIRRYQSEGHLVAMTGDGTNDAPALAQADVAVAMNSGTQAAKEAGNMVDLDSDPTKLLEIVRVGKQLLMTRGSLTTFSLANDIAKYFVILPAAFGGIYPQLERLDLMRLRSPTTAVLSAVAFNALVIVGLVPLALKGVSYRPRPAADLLRTNLMVWGVGGLILPFPCIKAIDLVLSACGVR